MGSSEGYTEGISEGSVEGKVDGSFVGFSVVIDDGTMVDGVADGRRDGLDNEGTCDGFRVGTNVEQKDEEP